MRIIDKQSDYYDYLQDPTDTLVFDRRGSHLITKEEMCEHLHRADDNTHSFLLLQCGINYWLILATITERKPSTIIGLNSLYPSNYTLEVLTTWVDYSKPAEDISFIQIQPNNMWRYHLYAYDHKVSHRRYLVLDAIRNHVDDLKDAVMHNDYRVVDKLHIVREQVKDGKGRYSYNTKKVHPIFRACGIAGIIPADAIYNAIDEYFSLKKSSAETTVAKGTTNDDKIVNHGFDLKTSFRGKTRR